MADDSAAPLQASALQASHVYAMAIVCLAAGLGIGYLMRSSQLSVPVPQRAAATAPHAALPPGHPHSLEDLKALSDQKAAPLLEKLKATPNDTALLTEIAALYHSTHRFQEASVYYKKAVDLDQKNVIFRTKYAASLYRNSDIDGAIAQLNQALVYEPKDANALFNLGLIKLQGKGDRQGAVAAWKQLLKSNPDLSTDRRDTVIKVMNEAMHAKTSASGELNPGDANANQ